MSAPALRERRVDAGAVELAAFGELAPISRLGGQGRVHVPSSVPAALAAEPIVVKLYRRAPTVNGAAVLADMIAWRHALEPVPRAQLDEVAAWPRATVTAAGALAGIAMRDLRPSFDALFTMPSGRREHVLLGLEHLLGGDGYLRQRGLAVTLDTRVRVAVAERIAAALALLHRHAIVAGDIAPSNVLVAFSDATPRVCFIDCDSMVFRGRQGLASVETVDWQIPDAFDESPSTRAADAYKLCLVVLRLLARSHAERALPPVGIPARLRPLLARGLSADARNRPPAGEWTRALRVTLSDPELVRPHPGPAQRGPRLVVRPPAARARPAPAPQPPLVGRRARRRSASMDAVRMALMLAAVLLCGFFLVRVFTLAVGSSGPALTTQGLPYYEPAPRGFPGHAP